MRGQNWRQQGHSDAQRRSCSSPEAAAAAALIRSMYCRFRVRRWLACMRFWFRAPAEEDKKKLP
jgi:hypothetical protein